MYNRKENRYEKTALILAAALCAALLSGTLGVAAEENMPAVDEYEYDDEYADYETEDISEEEAYAE